LVSGLLFVGSVFLIGMTMQMLAEAAADGWEIRNAGGITGLALSIAPFGIYPLVTAALVGFAYFCSAWGKPIGIEVTLVSGTLFAIGLLLCAVSAHFTREQVYLDGGRPGTFGHGCYTPG
jgi:hypothetical protein